MKKIEEKMIQAITAKKSRKLGNTSVNVTETAKTLEITVCLFGNLIATIDYYNCKMTISDGGYLRTVTTKSRLNALLKELTARKHQFGVYQRKGEWYFSSSKGDVPFENNTELPTLIF